MTSAELQRVPNADVTGRGMNPAGQIAPAPELPVPAANDIDAWIGVVERYSWLANQIANTDFPPAEMRGKPAAIMACFLTGREQGLGPMTSLQNMHVIKGKVGQSPHLMRALIEAAGHELEYDEMTDSRVVVRGRRRGQDNWTTVTFTADQARRAKIDLGGYPEDKLVARATARLARRRFADVIAGMAHLSEELQDDGFDDDGARAPAAIEQGDGDAAAKPTRTAKRPEPTRARRATSSGPTPARQAAAAQRATSASDGPPLPGEDEPASDQVENREDPGNAAGQGPQSGDSAGSSSDTAPEGPPSPPAAKMVTKNQLGKLGVLFREAKVEDRTKRLQVVASMADRDISSSNELTQDEASELIDNLQDLGPDGIAAMAGAPTKDDAEQGQLEEPVDAEVVEDQGDTAGADA